MAKKHVVVYFVTDREKELAARAIPDAKVTDSFMLGALEESEIDPLRKQGLVVAERTELGKTADREDVFRSAADTSAGPRIASSEIGVLDSEKPNYYLVTLLGPLLEDWRRELASVSVKLLEALPDNVYRTKLDPAQAQALRHLPFVTEVRLFGKGETAVRRIPRIAATDAVAGSATSVAMRTYDVLLQSAQELEPVQKWLDEHKVGIAGSGRTKIRIYLLDNSPLLGQLQELPEVMRVEEYVPPRLYNDHARVLLGIDRTASQPEGAILDQTGKGQIVAVADTGFDETHGDVPAQRIIKVVALGRKGDSSDPDGHGTHVAGSILGDGTASNGLIRGTAPAAKLFFQSILDGDGGLGGLPLQLQDLFEQAYESDARIHNNSWGARTRGTYTANAIEVDDFVAQRRDMLILIAAGNEGTAAPPQQTAPGFVGWVSLSSPGTAKNALTVGASRSDRTSGGYSALTYGSAWPTEFPNKPIAECKVSGDPQGMAAYSSRGPCDDYRIKPDVVAPGTDIASMKSAIAPFSHYWGPVPGQPKYAFDGGTSMATPLTAGCAALIRQYYVEQRRTNPSAALLKATLINSTQWLTAADSVADNPKLPNYHQGFGRISMACAIPNKSDPALALEFYDNWQDKASYFVRTGQRAQFSFSIESGHELRLCMAYTDLAARSLQNNLNLALVHVNSDKKWLGNENLPMNLGIPDSINNVEVIRLEAPERGQYVVQVSASNLLQSDPGQDFALVVTGKGLIGLKKV